MTINPTTLLFVVFCIFMSAITWDAQQRLDQYYQAQKIIKIPSFEARKIKLSQADQEILELWESFLTGRSGPVSKWIKEDYKNLGLNHVFSPSGFHLSAILVPLTFLFPFRKFQLALLLGLGISFYFLPGQWALKRVLSMKIGQHFFGLKAGLVIAIVLDILTGSLEQSPLSFIFSYLFLSLIIFQKSSLNIYFFFSQMLIFYFFSELISPLLLIISPILNLILTLAFPLLCILAIPMGDWSFESGMMIMRSLQFCVKLGSKITSSFPLLEVNVGLVFICFFVFRAQKKMIYICLLFMVQTINSSPTERIKLGTYDFLPQGKMIKSQKTENFMKIYYHDGICLQELKHGLWWEKCSPRRRSIRKKTKKLSFPSREQQKSSPRELHT